MSEHLPLNALRAFEAVVRTGSFKAAAEQLFVTQSAVSHQVKHLEDWFGTPLFEREGNRPKPLPAGQELARVLTLSFGQIATACQQVRAEAAQTALVIAAIPSVALLWLIPRLQGFREAHPEIDVRIVYAMHGRDIDFRAVHLAFVFGWGGEQLPGTRIEPFLPGHAVAVCSPALAEQMEQPYCAEGIARLGVLHDTDRNGWKEWFERAKATVPAPQTGPVYEDFNLLRAAALSGQGVALCPLAMIRPDLEAGRLVRLSEMMVKEDSGYYLLWGPLSGTPMMEPARAFRDWAFSERSLQDWSLA